LPRATTSTLFPYTTLFRSKEGPCCWDRLSQRREIQRPGTDSPQDPSGQRNLHYRIPKQRPQTVSRKEDLDGMPAHQAGGWGRSACESRRSTHWLSGVGGCRATGQFSGNLKVHHLVAGLSVHVGT